MVIEELVIFMGGVLIYARVEYAGATGGHQSGILLSKLGSEILFCN